MEAVAALRQFHGHRVLEPLAEVLGNVGSCSQDQQLWSRFERSIVDRVDPSVDLAVDPSVDPAANPVDPLVDPADPADKAC
jgi:hypothetical protein